MAKTRAERLMDEIKKDIDRKDMQEVKNIIEKYFRKGIWGRVTHPVFKRGFIRGFIVATVWWGFIIFFFGPFIFGE